MKAKLITFSFELLADLFSDGPHNAPRAYVVTNGFPPDAKLARARFSCSGVELVITSDSFPEVDDGAVLDKLEMRVTHT